MPTPYCFFSIISDVFGLTFFVIYLFWHMYYLPNRSIVSDQFITATMAKNSGFIYRCIDLDHFFGIVRYYCQQHPSYWMRRDNASWASHFSFIGNEDDHPKLVAKICVHLLPPIDTVVAKSVSLYALFGNF